MIVNSIIISSFISFIGVCSGSNDTYYTCADWMSNHNYNELSDGTYTVIGINIDNSSSSILQVYCVFDYTNHYAWTLIESATQCAMTDELESAYFTSDISYNENNVQESKNSLYRLSLTWMDSIRSQSDLFLATCNMDTSFSKDWVLMNLTDTEYNPFETEYFHSVCTSAVSADIRGYTCQDATIQTWQGDPFHWHIDSSHTGLFVFVFVFILYCYFFFA